MGLEPLKSRQLLLSARFEKVGKSFAEIDLKCDKEFLETQGALVSAKEAQRFVEDVEAAENDDLHYPEMNNQLTRKVGFEGNTNIGPVLEHNQLLAR